MSYLIHDHERDSLLRVIEMCSKEALEAKLETIREEARKDGDSPYPSYAGHLLFFVGELRRQAQRMDAQLQQTKRELESLKWAAECTLVEDCGVTNEDVDGEGEVWERLYEAAEIVAKAMDEKMTFDQLRMHLADGVTELEYQHKRFLDADEVCADCEAYIGKGGKCKDCTIETADSPAA